MSETKTDLAFRRGYNAYINSIEKDQNPYNQTTQQDEFVSWDEGWIYSFEFHQDAPDYYD